MKVLVVRHYANSSSTSSVSPCLSFKDSSPSMELCRAVDFCHKLRAEEDESAPDSIGRRSVDMALVCEALERSAGIEDPGHETTGGGAGGGAEGQSRLGFHLQKIFDAHCPFRSAKR